MSGEGEAPAEPRGSAGAAPCPIAIGLLYLAAGLAFLVKGPVGVALLVGPVAVGIVVGRRWGFFRSWAHVLGLLIFAGLCLAWPLMLYRRGGRELLNGFLVDNVFYRFAPPAEGGYAGGHRNPFWYYLTQFPLEVLPWLAVFPAIVAWLRRRRWPAGWNPSALLFLASVFPVGLLLLSVPATKRGLYLLPLLAPLGATVGAWLAAAVRPEHATRLDRGTQKLLVILLAAVLAAGTAAVAAIYLKPSLLARQKPDLSALRASAVTPGLLGLSAAAVVAMVVRAARLWRRNATPLGLLAGWAGLALFVLGGSLAFRTLDGFKNLHRMTADLVTLGAASPSLVGYHMDEVTQGIIPFDTGMMPRNLADPAELRRHILANPSGKLLTLERHVHEFPDDLRSRLRLVRSWSYGSHRAYALYEISAAPPEE